MATYAKGYNHDAIAWCGQFVAYCMASNGIEPPFGASDTDKYLWAKSWAKWGKRLLSPVLGCVMVFDRAGGGHVALYERESDSHYYVTGGNQSDTVSTTAIPRGNLVAMRWPPEPQIGTSPMPANSGRGSWYSQYDGKYEWVDKGDLPGSNALGVPDYEQGIAFYNRATLGDWFNVTAPNGKTLRLRQTDIGPHPNTGRSIDIAAVAAERFGYTPSNFPTDGIFSWVPAGQAVDPPVIIPPVIVPPVVPIVTPPADMPDFERLINFIAANRDDIKLLLRFLGLSGAPVAVSTASVALPSPEPSKVAAALSRPSVTGSLGVAAAAATAMAPGVEALPPPTDLLTALPLLIPAVTALVGGMGGWTALAGFAANILSGVAKK
jgi:uncharacterized protein (TIGR02594 family)